MRKARPPRSLWTNPIHFIACGFGFGAARYLPGTFGTLVGIPFYLLLRHFSPVHYLFIVLITFIVGVKICDITARSFGVDDHPAIVWDEMVGYWITMFLVPMKFNWIWIIVGFFLFRLFDIWKPWPIRWFDQSVKGGLGIMVDDVIAGIYAWVILQAIIFWVLQ